MSMGTRASANDRFDEKVSRSEHGCWEWTGAKTRKGYGHMYCDGKYVSAHRYAYERWVGPIHGGKHVCHQCDNPSCVNPTHLWLGTNSDNHADKRVKGRVRADRNPNAKLDWPTVWRIRAMASMGATRRWLSRRFGLSTGHLHGIISYQTWAS